MEQSHDLLNNDLLINDISKGNLNSAAKWGRFLAIVGIIFCVLMVLGGIAVQVAVPSLNSYGYSNPFLQYIGIIYIVFAAILFFPCLYLMKFSNKMLDAIRASNQENLDAAFINLKAMFKFYGIFTIVILVIYAIVFVVGIGGMMR